MSLNRHDDRCPECGYPNPVRQGTFEGGFGGMRGADTALLMCGDTACRFVWDTEMEFPDSPHWASKPLTIVRAVQTCTAVPSQWDAWTADGQYLYLRYRSGCGTVDTYDDPDWETWTAPPDGAIARFGEGFETRSYDGEITLAEFCQRAGLVLALPGAGHQMVELVPYIPRTRLGRGFWWVLRSAVAWWERTVDRCEGWWRR